MNYAEDLVYWYLRLNGFFPIANFVIHKFDRIEHTSDCDVLVIRTPYVYEQICGRHEDWERDLTEALDCDEIARGVLASFCHRREFVRMVWSSDRGSLTKNAVARTT